MPEAGSATQTPIKRITKRAQLEPDPKPKTRKSEPRRTETKHHMNDPKYRRCRTMTRAE